ncbi:MAG TPA: TonB-dependent receptor [Rhizomicrobium sp.]|nr:TonB-dependent receptor [Rhizomicrobium sp.]
MATSVAAESFNIPAGDMDHALRSYMSQSGVQLLVPDNLVKGVRTNGVKGEFSADDALTRILRGSGLIRHREDGAMVILRGAQTEALEIPRMEFAQAAPAPRSVETVTVTSSKLGGGSVQSIPISITALSQEQLTATQTNGGPDLIKQVPNMTFTKTNFSGYSIQLRGIGTQAISVTTDPAVAVAFNDIPFIRNHFFEQEFYDVAQVEVLRGPQGTLYGRNATAGVVNLTSAKPTDQFEAMVSAELGNYHQKRFEAMLNLPLLDDRVAVRLAGEWTKRQGYSFNELSNERVDGRDLWSGRMTIGWKPSSKVQAYLVWEHFSEDDDRMRSAKQLCKTDPLPDHVGNEETPPPGQRLNESSNMGGYFSQGCQMGSLYSPESFGVPNGFSLPYVSAGLYGGILHIGQNPYASTTQSRNLRIIETSLDPIYKVKNDLAELNIDYNVTPQITITSQTGYNQDFLWATQDYNRFNTTPGFFNPAGVGASGNPTRDTSKVDYGLLSPDGVFCDPQLGCSDRLVAQDLSTEHAWQVSQEFRLTTNFDGPLNFSAGGNYLHYETAENYYVFINVMTAFTYWMGDLPALRPEVGHWIPNVTDGHQCLAGATVNGRGGFQYSDPSAPTAPPGNNSCIYIDPNPLSNVNNDGHNYFLSQNPYGLNSYALFGEANYQLADDLKLTGGLRWTRDDKHFTLIPSQFTTGGFGYPSSGVVDQSWGEVTGRAVANWTPDLSFTDQTLVFGSYARGYKAGGANPPGPVLIAYGDGDQTNPIHPLTFDPEFINAFEIGTKNTLFDGALTLNASAFYYDYKGYQISEIVDRTSINLNFNAKVKGAEIEGAWEPLPGLRFNFAGGWEDTSLNKGSKAVDLIDRTAGQPGWMVLKPFIGQASNCILPTSVVEAAIKHQVISSTSNSPGSVVEMCGTAYVNHFDPVTALPFTLPDSAGNLIGDTAFGPQTISGYAGFDPLTAPNNGQGFDKDLSGNKLPNAPPFTVSAGAQYSIPLSAEWAGTLRGDYYWQDYSWARVFNDNPYDRLRGYGSVNLTLILTSQDGWQVMLYDKNVFNTTAITGTFLNSDDSGLTTNVFLTDPKLIGVRVTKNW